MILDKHHITLYIVGIVFALGLTYLYESNKANQEHDQYVKEKALSDLKDQQNTQFQQQIQATVKQLQDINIQQTAINAQQASTIDVLKKQLQNQKGKDATLPPTDLANRIQTLAPGGTIAVVVNGFQIDQTEAVVIAQALEEPPILKQELAADETIIKNDMGIIANDAKILDAEKQAHASDNAAAVADKATLNQEIVTVKAEARKSKFKWFFAGVVTGFTLGHIRNLSF
jgi:hypothetical protein